MRNVVIVMPPVLPVPCVRGGAIETLMQCLIDQNEKEKRLLITLISVYDKDAYILSKKYCYTKFVFLHTQTTISKTKYQLSRVIRRITGIRPLALDDYNRKITDVVIGINPDLCIVEGGSYTKEYSKLANNLGKARMVLHLHACFYAPKNVDNIFPNIIAISEFVKETWRLDSEASIEVLKNCIDSESFQKRIPQREIDELMQQNGIAEGKFLLLFVGRLIPVKGIRELMLVVERIPEVQLLIIGKSDNSTRVNIQYNEELKIIVQRANNIKLLGYKPNCDLEKYYQMVQAVAVPSLWEEGAGLVVIEAMSCGKPLIITDSGGMREYVATQGYCLIERNDFDRTAFEALQSMANDKGKCEAMGKANFEESKKYTSKNYYNHFCEIIDHFMYGANKA